MSRTRRTLTIAALLLATVPVVAQDDATWNKVEDMLVKTQDVLVLDKTDKAPSRKPNKNPVYGDWMVRHQLSDPQNLNPYTSSDAGASDVTGHILETMLLPHHEPPFDLRGHLAVGYPEISEDKLTYTFTVRENARFADGKLLSAADVHFSIKTILNPKVLAPHSRNYYASIMDVKQLSKYQISFFMKEAYFRNDVSLGLLDVIPKHYYDPDGLMDNVTVAELKDGSWESGPNAEAVDRFAEQFNQNFNRVILGTGPYVLKNPEEDLVTGQKVVLSRNENYWGAGIDLPNGPGYLDRILFKTINNQDAAFIELTNGNLDLHTLKPLEFKEKSWSPEFLDQFLKVVEYRGQYNYIGWNNKHPIFKDKRVRRAMTLLTDREGMVKNLLFGLGEVIVGPVHRTRPEYNVNIKTLPFDSDAAIDLLLEAGWSDSDSDGLLDKKIDGVTTMFKFTMLVNSGNQLRKDIALTLQGECADLGIEVEVRELDWSVFLEDVKAQRADAYVLGWRYSLAYYPDPYQIWHSSQAKDGGSNSVAFTNDEVDQILETYRQTFETEKRKELLYRFQEIIHEEQPYTFLWNPRSTRAYSRRYQNVNWYSIGGDQAEWFVKPGARLYSN